MNLTNPKLCNSSVKVVWRNLFSLGLIKIFVLVSSEDKEYTASNIIIWYLDNEIDIFSYIQYIKFFGNSILLSFGKSILFLYDTMYVYCFFAKQQDYSPCMLHNMSCGSAVSRSYINDKCCNLSWETTEHLAIFNLWIRKTFSWQLSIYLHISMASSFCSGCDFTTGPAETAEHHALHHRPGAVSRHLQWKRAHIPAPQWQGLELPACPLQRELLQTQRCGSLLLLIKSNMQWWCFGCGAVIICFL